MTYLLRRLRSYGGVVLAAISGLKRRSCGGASHAESENQITA